MEKDALQRYFFVGLLLLVSVIVLFMFLPFLEVLVLSTIFGVVLTPLHRQMAKALKGRNGIAAFLVIVLFAAIVIVPAFFLASQVLSESKGIYDNLTGSGTTDYVQKMTDIIEGPLKQFYPGFNLNISEFASLSANWITGHLSSILSSVLSIVTGIILIFISLFFFLRDGSRFKDILIDLSPLSDKYDEEIFTKLKNTITSTVKGVLLVAVVQGILAGLGMWIFQVPNYTLWGSVSAVASLIPGLGTAVVFIPAIAYMFIIGNTAYAVGLILWSALIVGTVDNFLTPYLYSRSVEIHQLIMLFAVLGGLSVFGPIGFIFGPIIISLFFALIDIYQSIILKKNSL